jgi:erythromycin esterase-like protein
VKLISAILASLAPLLAAVYACSGSGLLGTEGISANSKTSVAPADSEDMHTAASAVSRAAIPISGSGQDYAAMIAATSNVRRFMLGESTHGTSEFYRERGRLTEQLIQTHGANAIAVEGDWSPSWRVNLYVRGLSKDRNAAEALRGFTNFPQWMWPNADFADFIERLRASNLLKPEAQRVGVYGMDVYDIFDAADFVVAYLRTHDTTAATRAEKLYRCFRPYKRSTSAYGEATVGRRTSCHKEAEAVTGIVGTIRRPNEIREAEEHFAAVRAAASVKAGEEYFRVAYGGSLAWNARDRSMERTVEDIAAHAEAQTGRPGKVVIWSHNSHTGDARATDMRNRGELNLGQLMRERHGDAAFLIGYFAHGGTVFAAPAWEERGRTYDMRPAIPGSHAALLRASGAPAFSLLIRGNKKLASLLEAPMEQRAIGVVYRPEGERQSHYFRASLSNQFDAVVYLDHSTAVTPLRRLAGFNTGQ